MNRWVIIFPNRGSGIVKYAFRKRGEEIKWMKTFVRIRRVLAPCLRSIGKSILILLQKSL